MDVITEFYNAIKNAKTPGMRAAHAWVLSSWSYYTKEEMTIISAARALPEDERTPEMKALLAKPAPPGDAKLKQRMLQKMTPNERKLYKRAAEWSQGALIKVMAEQKIVWR